MDKFFALLNSSDANAWQRNLDALGQELGYPTFLFALKPNKNATLSSSIIFSNHPSAWREHYQRSLLHEIDPVIQHSLRSAIPQSWDGSAFLSPAQQAMHEEARRYGMTSGVCLPIHGINGEFGLLNFSTPSPLPAPAIAHDIVSAMTLVRDYAQESFLRLHPWRPESEKAPRLTPRELECLKWIMAGKTSWEMSRIFSCAEVTVNFHVKNLMKKFDVQSRQHAVLRGIQHGLISPL
ncbi:helix-turn-helix transcriptional regulator [Chromobacterium sp. CV08]|uniref:helix-turn-helix transcriptional regulator n=1 Tax=Chromobacterium sp. CV08 TaxID=3133274 RepID=UPI003DA96B4F